MQPWLESTATRTLNPTHAVSTTCTGIMHGLDLVESNAFVQNADLLSLSSRALPMCWWGECMTFVLPAIHN
jgi:hypothetical protein